MNNFLDFLNAIKSNFSWYLPALILYSLFNYISYKHNNDVTTIKKLLEIPVLNMEERRRSFKRNLFLKLVFYVLVMIIDGVITEFSWIYFNIQQNNTIMSIITLSVGGTIFFIIYIFCFRLIIKNHEYLNRSKYVPFCSLDDSKKSKNKEFIILKIINNKMLILANSYYYFNKRGKRLKNFNVDKKTHQLISIRGHRSIKDITYLSKCSFYYVGISSDLM